MGRRELGWSPGGGSLAPSGWRGQTPEGWGTGTSSSPGGRAGAIGGLAGAGAIGGLAGAGARHGGQHQQQEQEQEHKELDEQEK